MLTRPSHVTQARIALLEGERRSADNLKTDLSRRVKLLEFALRQERSVFLLASPYLTIWPTDRLRSPGT